MEKIENTYFKLEYNKKNTEETSVLLEIYRGVLYNELLNKFIQSCLHNFKQNVFSNKKKYYRTLVNLLSSWIFTQYSYYDFSKDPFFPNTFNHNDLLKETLYNYTTLHNIQNVDEKINNVITNITNTYNNILEKLENYKCGIFYNKNKNNIIVTKKLITQKRDNLNIYFYKFNIKYDVNIYINNVRLLNIINNIILPVNEYNNMKDRYTGDINMLDTYIWIILYRYQLLGSNNNQLAVLPDVLDKMNKDLNFNFECFASAINTSTKNFCSLYYDIEKYFGSVGSFFNINMNKGIFSFNPPYQTDIIERGIEKIFNLLDNTDNDLEFIITIPIWDIKGKKIMENSNSENNNNNINYGDFKIINKIFSSKYFKGKLMVSKNNFTYIDHNFCLYKNTTIQNTYVILLSNFENNHFDIIKEYDFFTFNYDNLIIDL